MPFISIRVNTSADNIKKTSYGYIYIYIYTFMQVTTYSMSVCLLLFVFLALQPIMVVFSQPGSGL